MFRRQIRTFNFGFIFSANKFEIEHSIFEIR